MKVATFRVIDSKTAKVIKAYELEYTDIEHLNGLFHEARKVWAEYQVEVDTPNFLFSYSHTWKEQMAISPFAV
jgi:hypothetical protein